MPTAAEKSTIKFYAPNATRKQLVEKIPKWRGDHRGCQHRTGECYAPYAWCVTDKTWVIRADFAGVSIEPNMLGTHQGNEKGSYPEPIWKSKGWVETSEAEGVVPSDEVKQWHIDRIVKERRANMEAKKYEPARVDKECDDLRAAAEKANGFGLKPAKGARE